MSETLTVGSPTLTGIDSHTGVGAIFNPGLYPHAAIVENLSPIAVVLPEIDGLSLEAAGTAQDRATVTIPDMGAMFRLLTSIEMLADTHYSMGLLRLKGAGISFDGSSVDIEITEGVKGYVYIPDDPRAVLIGDTINVYLFANGVQMSQGAVIVSDARGAFDYTFWGFEAQISGKTIEIRAQFARGGAPTSEMIASEPLAIPDTYAPGDPSVTITEDTNQDGELTAGELSGNLDVRVNLPGDAIAGDVLWVTDGTTPQTIGLNAGHISAGYVMAAFAAPTANGTLTISARVTDAAGNPSGTVDKPIDVSVVARVWSAAPSMLAGRSDHRAAGTASDSIVVAGRDSSYAQISSCLTFNNTSWSSSISALAVRGRFGIAGMPLAALIFGGEGKNSTETRNGTTWASSAGLPQIRGSVSGGGSVSDAISVGGEATAWAATSTANKFNGTSWSATASMITARSSHVAVGAASDMFIMFGYGATMNSLFSTEIFNGTSWASGPNGLGSEGPRWGSGAGGAASVIHVGGWEGNPVNQTRLVKNYVFTVAANFSAGRQDLSSAGTPSDAMLMGGCPYAASGLASCERYR